MSIGFPICLFLIVFFFYKLKIGNKCALSCNCPLTFVCFNCNGETKMFSQNPPSVDHAPLSLEGVLGVMRERIGKLYNMQLVVLSRQLFGSFYDARNHMISVACLTNKPERPGVVPVGAGQSSEVYLYKGGEDFVVRIPLKGTSWRNELAKIERYDILGGKMGDEITASAFDVLVVPYEGRGQIEMCVGVVMQRLMIFRPNMNIREWPTLNNDINRIAASILSPLIKMVKKGVFHDDLHNQNVVLTTEGVAKIIDFDGGCDTQAAEGVATCDVHMFGDLCPEYLLGIDVFEKKELNESSSQKWRDYARMYCDFLAKYFPSKYNIIFQPGLDHNRDFEEMAQQITDHLSRNTHCDVGSMKRCFVESQVYAIAQLTITKLIVPQQEFNAVNVLLNFPDRSNLEEGLDPDFFRLLVKCLYLVPEQRPSLDDLQKMVDKFL